MNVWTIPAWGYPFIFTDECCNTLSRRLHAPYHLLRSDRRLVAVPVVLMEQHDIPVFIVGSDYGSAAVATVDGLPVIPQHNLPIERSKDDR